MKTTKLIGVLVMSVLLAGAFAVVRTARAQESDDLVVFLVPHLIPVTTGSQGEIVYVGRSSAGVDVTGCAAAGQLSPSQSVIIFEPGGGEPPFRLDGLITLSVNGEPRTTEMPNGTRLSNMTAPTQCNIGEQTYDRYAATVQ